MLEEIVNDYIDMYVGDNMGKGDRDFEGLTEWVRKTFLVDISIWEPKPENLSYDELGEKLLQTLLDLYEDREQKMGSETMRNLEHIVMLNRIDEHWVDHLYNMDYMEEGIGLRAYGQKDPLVEFKREGHEMFSEMIQRIKEDVVEYMFKIQVIEDGEEQKRTQGPKQTPRRRAVIPVEKEAAAVNAPAKSVPKVGRNDPCPCGSGKKYKKCCGR